MKGLLLKDWYVTWKYGKLQLGIVVLMTALSLIRDLGTYYLFYVVLFAGTIPVYTLSVDETRKWNRFAQTLPYSRRDVVTGKYVYTLLVLGATACVLQLLWAGRAVIMGESVGDVMCIISVMLAIGLVFPTFDLPFMYRMGVEKGRIVMLVIFALFFGAFFVTQSIGSDNTDLGIAEFSVRMGDAALLILMGMLALFFLSWLLAVKLYERREL